MAARGRNGEAPARYFDLSVALVAAKAAVDDEGTEDAALTDFLTRAWLELANPLYTPVPRCPHCDGLQIRNGRCGGTKTLPVFICVPCQRRFTRLTGTPFARLRNRPKGPALFPVLVFA